MYKLNAEKNDKKRANKNVYIKRIKDNINNNKPVIIPILL